MNTKTLPMPKKLTPYYPTDTAKAVLQKRYQAKDENGETIETSEQMFWRVASAIALKELEGTGFVQEEAIAKAEKYYKLMVTGVFLPNSPTLMNAGKPNGQLSACFVLPVGDSIPEIFDAIKYAALIHKSGGGTGFSFSNLRPKNSTVASTGGIASGPLSFLKIFNTATEQIKQGGTRRGANMGILRVDHPDIIEFIKAKEVEGELNNFNLSVAITDRFMDCLEKDESYELYDPHQQTIVGTASAKHVWDLLVDRAWLSGDPGIVFIDEINRHNPTPHTGKIEATNPCGEQPLLAYEACNLGSINLAKFFIRPNDRRELHSNMEMIDWTRLSRTVHAAVRFLDAVIDANCYPLPQIDKQVKATRKIGLGVMGFADLLFQMRVPYNSDEAVDIAKRLMSHIDNEAHSVSINMARKKGHYPAYQIPEYDYGTSNSPMRNATVTTIAPTGTLSIIANCSSGIEPVFALSFTKNIMGGEKFTETNPYLINDLNELDLLTEDVIAAIAEKGTIQHLTQLPQWMRDVYVTAMDIEPIWHLKMQAAFQQHTDNAVSKTINLPNSATREDIDFIYREAHRLKCKGTTVYRDGCKSIQVLTTGEGQKRQEGNTEPPAAAAATENKTKVERPAIVFGFTQKIQTGLGAVYLTINELDGKPFEVFATVGKSGHSITAKTEAIGRLISLALRSGISVERIITQLKGIGGEHPVFKPHGMMLSIPDAIAHVLEEHYVKHPVKVRHTLDKNICPDCGAELQLQEGCASCHSCGYSKCS